MYEDWKDIKGYEGLYQISNLGRIKSVERHDTLGRHVRERKLKFQSNKDGYLNVTLRSNNVKKTYLVHRLVAKTFIPNPHGFPEINHKDTIRNNCMASNLEWCDRKYNVNYADAKEKIIKKHQKKVAQIDKYGKIKQIFSSIKEASKNIKIPDSNISACCKGKRKTAGGYAWKYINKEVVTS